MKKITVVFLACILACVCICASGCSLFNYGDDDQAVALSTPMSVKYTTYKAISGTIERSVSGVCELITEDADLEKCSFTYEDLGDDTHYFEKYEVKTGSEVHVGDVIARTTDGIPLTAKTDGYVTYLNSEYSNILKQNKEVAAGKIMAVIDPKNAKQAKLVWSISAENLEGFDIGVGTVVDLHIITSSKEYETFTGTIDCEYTENVEGLDDYTEYGNWEYNSTRKFTITTENIPESLGIEVGDRLSVKYTAEIYEDAVLVPKEAVDTYKGKTFVYIQDSLGLKREKYVTTGISNDTMIQIVEGLEAGDLIIQY